MTNQYESAIEQSEARIKEIQEGAKRCRKNAQAFHKMWIRLFWCSLIVACAWLIAAILTVQPFCLLVTLLFMVGAWWTSAQAPIAHSDFEKLAHEYEEMEESERDFLANLQTSLREWRGY